MIYVPGFIRIGSGIQKFTGGREVYRDTQHGNLIGFLSLWILDNFQQEKR
jgi:hypothetical protein